MKDISELTKEEVESILKGKRSVAEALRLAGYPDNSSVSNKLRRLCKRFGLDKNKLVKRGLQVKYSKEILEPIVLSSLSYAQCLRKLNIVPAGGNYKTLQRNIDIFGIDCSHMKHQAINQGVELKTFDNLTSNDAIKVRLVKERGYKCEICSLSEWMNKPICIELEHVDGNNRNNEKANLKLICPNCHSQTPTWRNRKRMK